MFHCGPTSTRYMSSDAEIRGVARFKDTFEQFRDRVQITCNHEVSEAQDVELQKTWIFDLRAAHTESARPKQSLLLKKPEKCLG